MFAGPLRSDEHAAFFIAQTPSCNGCRPLMTSVTGFSGWTDKIAALLHIITHGRLGAGLTGRVKPSQAATSWEGNVAYVRNNGVGGLEEGPDLCRYD